MCVVSKAVATLALTAVLESLGCGQTDSPPNIGGPPDATTDGAVDAELEHRDGGASKEDGAGDAPADRDGDGASPPICPPGATTFATTELPSAITLDPVNAYWTNAPSSGQDAGGFMEGAGAIRSLGRATPHGLLETLVGGLYDSLFITASNGFLAFTDFGTGGDMGGVVYDYEIATLALRSPASRLVGPAGVALDDANEYWVADTDAGVSVALAPVPVGAAVLLGTAAGSYTGGGLSLRSGTLYFTAASSPLGSGGVMFMVSSSGGTPEAMQTFTTGQPYDVRTDMTNVYFSDVGTGAVYSMPLGGGTLTTMATGLGRPYQLAVDSHNVYTADSMGGGIYEIAIDGGSPKKLLSATSPRGIAADDNDDLVYFTIPTGICTVAK
jgi:hypothetical protein